MQAKDWKTTSWAILAVGCLSVAAIGEDETTPASPATRVLSVLSARCFECHGPDRERPKSGLRVDTRDALLRGGYGGPALVPGEPEQSSLWTALTYADEDLQMPPDGKLPAEELELIESWIRDGAPWPEADASPAASPFPPESLRFFEERIRPLLVESCFDCHGPEREHPKGGLRMTGRSAFLRGGDSGPAVDVEDPERSLLLSAVRYTDPERKMPPTGKLSDRAIRDLEDWIRLGAPWPDEETLPAEPHAGIDVAAGRDRWAFRPVERPPVPEVRDTDWARNEIDAFVLHGLEEAGLEPNPEADRATLLQRLSFVLHGLPVTLDEVRAFENDPDPHAWRRRVDDALAQRAYGERWARHWFDVVRYAQTNGYERDDEKPLIWRYRDWVIDALCADLPYDRFLLEQLAGDELDDASPGSLIATGFYRLGAWDREPNDTIQAEFDELDDVLRTITEGTLGVTLGCARCHDHKFDPFPQEDYYSMLAFLRGVARYEEPAFHPESATMTMLDDSAEELLRWQQDWKEHRDALDAEREAILAEARKLYHADLRKELSPELLAALDKEAGARTDADRRLLANARGLRPTIADLRPYLSGEQRIRMVKAFAEQELVSKSYRGNADWAMTVSENGAEPPETHVLRRGRASSPGDEVRPRFLRVLCPDDETAAPPSVVLDPERPSSGRRRQLAEWIASERNPLTARVIVNRVWHHHFGRGIVPTTNDFGSTGLPPSHPGLLDWLAAEFVERGWSLKWLHTVILESATWRMSSDANRPEARELDPDNRLLWRQSLRRRDAEALRDSVLAVSGLLQETDGEEAGRGFFPRVSREVLGGMSKPGYGWGYSEDSERNRRSVYAFVKRGLAAPIFEAFDSPPASLPVGARAVTTTATQALNLLNGELVDRASRALARRAVEEVGPAPGPALERAFEHALRRSPTDEERAALSDYAARVEAELARRDEHVVFRPRVPLRLAAGFVELSEGTDLLFGPRREWRYLTGEWDLPYNDTLQAERQRGPAALFQRTPFAHGELTTRFRIDRGAQLASFLIDAAGEEFVESGLELAFLPEAGAVELWLHRDGETRTLAREELEITSDEWHGLRLVRNSDGVQAELDGVALLRADVDVTPGDGSFGVRVLGEAVVLERTSLRSGPLADDAPPLRILPDPAGPARLRALASVCQALLNTNEFLHVD